MSHSSNADENMDFLFQALMIYTQVICNLHRLDPEPNPVSYHSHPTCLDCFRQLPEFTLTSGPPAHFPSLYGTSLGSSLGTNGIRLTPTVPPDMISDEIGPEVEVDRSLGILTSYCLLMKSEHRSGINGPNLVPLSMARKLKIKEFIRSIW